MIDRTLFDIVKEKIKSLKGLDFQRFIEALYGHLYEKDFIPIKQKRDKGCDGILKNQTILAIYAPEKYNITQFKRKIEGDFKAYQKYWSKKYPKWQVIFNGELTAEMVSFIKKKKNDAEILGIDAIMQLIEKLYWSEQRKLFMNSLNIDKTWISRDILSKIVEDLLEKNQGENTADEYKMPVYIEEKIELNYSEEDIDTAKGEYEECLEDFSILFSILKAYDDKELKAIKGRIREDYKKFNGRFKDRLIRMTEEYSVNYPQDDLYKYYVRVVLIYFFEQCIIGKRTKREKDANSSARI